MHWIKWDKLCFPTNEGGLGFRKFEDMSETFSMKLWWNFRNGGSLWSAYMKAKYCSTVHPSKAILSPMASSVWKHMMSSKEEVENNCTWHVGAGDIYIFMTNGFLLSLLQ